MSLIKAIKHFKTITHHRHLVMINCIRCGIPIQGILHDLSKYTPTEFITGARYYEGTHSPNDSERFENGFSKAWMHHKGRNKHHFEYWTDYNLKTRTISPVAMPYQYVVEMFCDRIAACKTYKGDAYNPTLPLEYFRTHKYNDLMHDDTAKALEKMLVILAEQGEKKAFSVIRKQILKQKIRSLLD